MEMAGAAARADKTIRVMVAEYDGFSTTFREAEATELTVDGIGAVQAAVQATYARFPGMCLRVKVRRNGEFEGGELWRKGDPEAVWGRELYGEIADGDEVVIVVMAHGEPLVVASRVQAIALADALLERVRSITAPDTITEAT
jgi:hypothetical protein